MKEIYASTYYMDGACGVTNICDFEFDDTEDGYVSGTPLKDKLMPRGAGFGFAAFINTEECEEAYAILKKRFKITYQSPVRINTNSKRRFFFCTYDLYTKGTNV